MYTIFSCLSRTFVIYIQNILPENEINSGIPVTLATCVAAFSVAVFLPMSATSAATRADPCGVKSDWMLAAGSWCKHRAIKMLRLQEL